MTTRASKIVGIALRILDNLVPLAIAITFFVVVYRTVPFREVFEFDRDEGINLMKAALHGDGQRMYEKIWSDQPPFFTLMLAGWFKIAGATVDAGRVLVLILASVLVWSFYQAVRLTAGRLGALVGCGFLIFSGTHAVADGSLSSEFVRLSVSVMIGLPALALAMLGIYLLLQYSVGYRMVWLILSGAVFALSLHTKMFGGFLVPFLLLMLLGIGIERRAGVLAVFTPLLVWLLSATIVFGGVGFAYKMHKHRDQLLDTHMKKDVTKAQDSPGPDMLASMEKFDYRDYKPLAVVGLLAIPLCLRWKRLLPYYWLVAGYMILYRHAPVWYHHYLLLAIPLAWCAACGVAPIEDVFQRGRCTFLNGAKVVAALAALLVLLCPIQANIVTRNNLDLSFANRTPVTFLPEKIDRLRCSIAWLKSEDRLPRAERPVRPPTIYPVSVFAVERKGDPKAIEAMKKHADKTKWTFTDRPMYVFRAGLRCPPETVVISKKRMAGSLTIDQILDNFKKYKPEQVMLSRLLAGNSALRSEMRNDYMPLYSGRGDNFSATVSVRRDVAGPGATSAFEEPPRRRPGRPSFEPRPPAPTSRPARP